MNASRPSSIRCTISDCWSTRAGRWNRRLRWPAGSCPIASCICGDCWKLRLKKHGRREYIQVLRLLETFALEEVSGAIEDALRMNTISFDAVRHIVLCRIERRPPRLDLQNWPHLPLPRGANHRGCRLHDLARRHLDITGAFGHGGGVMNDKPEMPTPDTPQVLLEHHLKALRLPTILSEYDKVARQCAAEQVDYPRYLLRLTELELLDRDRRAIERRIRQAKFPVVKSLDSFEFLAIPSLNKTLVLELARCEFLSRKENLLLLGNSGTGKTHIALALGLAACQRGHRVRFTTAAALVSELIEARDDKHLLRFQKLLASYELLIVDELGYVPLSKSGAELLFETFSQRYERASTLVTSNLPFEEWTEVFGSERLTGALLDRITHHVHILEMNGDSYRLKQSRRKRNPPSDR